MKLFVPGTCGGSTGFAITRPVGTWADGAAVGGGASVTDLGRGAVLVVGVIADRISCGMVIAVFGCALMGEDMELIGDGWVRNVGGISTP